MQRLIAIWSGLEQCVVNKLANPVRMLRWHSSESTLASSAGVTMVAKQCANTEMEIGPVLRRQCWASAGCQQRFCSDSQRWSCTVCLY